MGGQRESARLQRQERVEPGVVDGELEVGELAQLVDGIDEDKAVAEDGALDEAQAGAVAARRALLRPWSTSGCNPMSATTLPRLLQPRARQQLRATCTAAPAAPAARLRHGDRAAVAAAAQAPWATTGGSGAGIGRGRQQRP